MAKKSRIPGRSWWGQTRGKAQISDNSLNEIRHTDTTDDRKGLEDTTPVGEGYASHDQESRQTSLCEPGFPDVPIEIWGGCWSRVLSKPWEAAEPQCTLEARA